MAQALQYRQRRRVDGYGITSIDGVSSSWKGRQSQTRRPNKTKKAPLFSTTVFRCTEPEASHQHSQRDSTGHKRESLIDALSQCQSEWQFPSSISTGNVAQTMANWQLSNQLSLGIALRLLQQSDQMKQAQPKQSGNVSFEPRGFVPHQAQTTMQTASDPPRILELLQSGQPEYSSTSPPPAQASVTAFQQITTDPEVLWHPQLSQHQNQAATRAVVFGQSLPTEPSGSLDPLPFDVEKPFLTGIDTTIMENEDRWKVQQQLFGPSLPRDSSTSREHAGASLW